MVLVSTMAVLVENKQAINKEQYLAPRQYCEQTKMFGDKINRCKTTAIVKDTGYVVEQNK